MYWPPLELEDGSAGTFLETSFEVSREGVTHWLKNVNAGCVETRMWRYQDWRSSAPYTQKRAMVLACLNKVHVHTQASDGQEGSRCREVNPPDRRAERAEMGARDALRLLPWNSPRVLARSLNADVRALMRELGWERAHRRLRADRRG